MNRKRIVRFISGILAGILLTAMSGLGNFEIALADDGMVGDITYVSTFNCIGLYWNPGIQGQENYNCTVQYRVCGTSVWQKGLDLWYDGRALNGRPPEFRGSIVGLSSGYTYEVKLTLNDGNATSKTITASTMSENFPIKETIEVNSANTTLHINYGGDVENGYVVYDGTGSTIDVGNAECCIEVNASWVIIRGFKLLHGRHGIKLVNGCQHVVIEDCDISEWGTGSGKYKEVNGEMKEIGKDWDSAIRFDYHDPNIGHIIIQRNKMYNPAYTANTWDDGHPSGPNGISISTDNNVGHNIIRYNEIYSTNGHGFNDCIQGEENASYNGCPGRDSDIYGNIIMNSFDDGIEADGGGMNVRIWGNYFDQNAVGVSSAANSMGPCYIFRNVANSFRKLYRKQRDHDDRLTFIKCGSEGYSGGKRYVFHNTLLNPPPTGGDKYAYGPASGIDQSGDCLENTVSRNNIFQTWKNWGSYIRDISHNTNNDFDYDLHNSDDYEFAAGNELHGIHGVPQYKPGHGYVSGSGGFYELAEDSPGYHAGAPIDNFNSGSNVDIGAHQSGTPQMEFGVNAYKTATPEPVLEFESIGDKSIHVGSTLTFSVLATISNGAVLTYSAKNLPDGAVFDVNTRTFNWTPQEGQEGTYQVTFTVSDGVNSTVESTVRITVNPAEVSIHPISDKHPGDTVTISGNTTLPNVDISVLCPNGDQYIQEIVESSGGAYSYIFSLASDLPSGTYKAIAGRNSSVAYMDFKVLPNNNPTPSVTPSPTPSVTPSPTPSVTPSPTPSVTPSPTPSVTPSPTPSETPSPTPSVTPSPTPSVTPSPTPSVTPSPTPSVTPSPTPSVTPSPMPSVTPSPTPSVTPSPTPSVTPSPTPSVTPSPTPTVTPSPTPSVTPSPTPTVTPSPTPSETPSPTPTVTPSPTPSVTPSPTPTVTPSPTPSVTPSPTLSVTPSPTPSVTPSPTPSVTPSPTPSVTPSPTPSVTPSPTPSVTPSPTPGVTPSLTPSVTPNPDNENNPVNPDNPSSPVNPNNPNTPNTSGNSKDTGQPISGNTGSPDTGSEDKGSNNEKADSGISDEKKNLTIAFSDVAEGFWAKDYIDFIASRGIINGMPDGSFKPGDMVTRAEFAKMITVAMGIVDENAVCSFSDINQSQWHYKYVASAVNAGIIKGKPDKNFAPDDKISRQEMAVMIFRALGEEAPESTDILLNFIDWENVSDWAKEGMAVIIERKIMNGKPGNILDPTGYSTRAEATAVIYRFCNHE